MHITQLEIDVGKSCAMDQANQLTYQTESPCRTVLILIQGSQATPMRSDGNCVIFSSQTGVNVTGSLKKLINLSSKHGKVIELKKVEPVMSDRFVQLFPKDRLAEIITSEFGMQYLLQKPKQLLFELWKQAIKEIATPCEPEVTRFISLHPVFYHSQSREFFSPLELAHLKKAIESAGLKVRLVVSLIDDVYDVYRRLRAPNHIFHPPEPKPHFEEAVEAVLDLMLLLDWRSNEIMTAEQIARTFGAEHYVLAVKHSIQVAYDLIFTEKIPVYVSHPISQVRVVENDGNKRLAQETKLEINRLVELLLQSDQIVPLYPTTIDEYIIEKRDNYFVPVLRPRWPTGNKDSLLFCPTPARINPLDPRGFYRGSSRSTSSRLNALHLLLRTLTERIKMQIGSRDRKLVEQSDGLVVYRPYFNGVPSLGVQQEIAHRNALVLHKVASQNDRVCVIASPSGDLFDNRIKTLIEKLSRAKRRGRKPTKKQLRQVELSLRRWKGLKEKFRSREMTGGELQQAVGRRAHEFVFEGIPQKEGPLEGDPRIRARAWLTQEWDRLARDLSRLDPIRDQLHESDILLDSVSVSELVGQAESSLAGNGRAK